MGAMNCHLATKTTKKVTKNTPKHRGQDGGEHPKSIANRDFSRVLLVKAATRPNCIAFCYHGGYELQFCYKNQQKVTKNHHKHKGQDGGEHPKSMGNHDFSCVLLVKAATRQNCIAFCYHGGYELSFGYKSHQKVTKNTPQT